MLSTPSRTRELAVHAGLLPPPPSSPVLTPSKPTEPNFFRSLSSHSLTAFMDSTTMGTSLSLSLAALDAMAVITMRHSHGLETTPRVSFLRASMLTRELMAFATGITLPRLESQLPATLMFPPTTQLP